MLLTWPKDGFHISSRDLMFKGREIEHDSLLPAQARTNQAGMKLQPSDSLCFQESGLQMQENRQHFLGKLSLASRRTLPFPFSDLCVSIYVVVIYFRESTLKRRRDRWLGACDLGQDCLDPHLRCLTDCLCGSGPFTHWHSKNNKGYLTRLLEHILRS